MKRNICFNLSLALGIALLLIGGVVIASRAQAQEPDPDLRGALAPQSAVDTAFIYQGRLIQNGNPISDTCDFKFTLYDDNQLFPTLVDGPVENLNVAVQDGYFATNVDFGGDAFTGEGRQMGIAVRCPASSGGYTDLSGLVMLHAAPYAHSLRPGAVISSSTAGELGAVLHVEDTYGGMLASTALEGQSVQGTGVRGESSSGYGVYGVATADTGTTYGVYGRSDSDDGYGIYSEGNAHVQGELTWEAKISYVSVPAAAFTAQDRATGHTNYGNRLINTPGGTFYAPVQLPHRATVTAMAFYWDDSTTDNITCTLRVDAMGAAGPANSVIAQVTSSGSSGYSSSVTGDIDPAYATVNNLKYIYYLEWNLIDSSTAGLGVIIEYTITEPY